MEGIGRETDVRIGEETMNAGGTQQLWGLGKVV
jgi:hypothetical protein